MSTNSPPSLEELGRGPSHLPGVVRWAERCRLATATFVDRHPWGVLLLVAFVGVGLRLSQYSTNRSLFLDEVFVASNVVDRSLSELMQPLKHDQRAPAGFLACVKLATEAFGSTDLVLRLVPLVSGIVCLLLFVPLARRHADSVGAFAATAIAAFSPALVFFASDLKQYSTDAAATVAILLAFPSRSDEDVSWWKWLRLGVVGAVAVPFSFPAVFVLAATGTTYGVFQCRTRSWKRLLGACCAAVPWGVAAIALYLIQVRHFEPNPGWKGMWAAGFMPMPPQSLRDLVWFHERLIHVVASSVGLVAAPIGALLMLLGVAESWRTNAYRTCLLLGPIAVSLAASALEVYPFAGRASVYLSPIFVLLMGLGVQALGRIPRPVTRFAAGLALLLLLTPPVLLSAAHFVRGDKYPNTGFMGYRFEEAKKALGFVADHAEPGDVVYVYSDARTTFGYYAERFGLSHLETVEGIQSACLNPSWEQFETDLEQLRGRGRVWIFMTHVWTSNGADDRHLCLHYLDRMGERKLSYESPPGEDAWAYLYDLPSVSSSEPVGRVATDGVHPPRTRR